jgi:hypothetical protein
MSEKADIECLKNGVFSNFRPLGGHHGQVTIKVTVRTRRDNFRILSVIREQTSARSAVRQGDFHAYACFIYSRKIGYRDLTQWRPLNPIMNMPDITIYKIGI